MADGKAERTLQYLPSSYAAQEFFRGFLSFADRIRTLEHWSDETYGQQVFPRRTALRLKKKRSNVRNQKDKAIEEQVREAAAHWNQQKAMKEDKAVFPANPEDGQRPKRKRKPRLRAPSAPVTVVADSDEIVLDDSSSDKAEQAAQQEDHFGKTAVRQEHIKAKAEWVDLPRPNAQNTQKIRHRTFTRCSSSSAAHTQSTAFEKDSLKVDTVAPQRIRTAANSTPSSKVGEQAATPMRLKPHLNKVQTTRDLLAFCTKEQLIAAHKIFVGCPECFGSLGGKCVKHLSTHWQGSQLLHATSTCPEEVPDEALKVRVMTASDIRRRGVELYLPYSESETVRGIKERVSELEGTPVDFQRLLVAGKYYDDDQATIEECGFDSSNTAFIVLQPQASKRTAGSACDWCFRAVGGVCTRHLISPKVLVAGKLVSSTPQRPSTAQARLPTTTNNSAASMTSLRTQSVGEPLVGTRPSSTDSGRGLRPGEEYFLGSGPRSRSASRATPHSYSTESTPVSIPSVQSSVLTGRPSPSVARQPASTKLSAFGTERTPSHFSSSHFSSSHFSSMPAPITKKITKGGGCPLCAQAVNGRCHRCLPVYKDGVEKDAFENLDQQYKEALDLAAAARDAVMRSEAHVWFTHAGVPCRKGTQVSVLFEDGDWHQGSVDAFHSRTNRVRLKFRDARIGKIHASLEEVQMRVLDPTRSSDAQLDGADDGGEQLEGGEPRLLGSADSAGAQEQTPSERPRNTEMRQRPHSSGAAKSSGRGTRVALQDTSERERARQRQVVRIPHQQLEAPSPDARPLSPLDVQQPSP